MCESNMTIEERAEELASAYGVSYHTALTALRHAVGCGIGMTEPIKVSVEEYEWLQRLLEDE